MNFTPSPATAAWQHRGARAGFEVAYFQALGGGCRLVYGESGLVLDYPGIAIRAG
jgi:hypothetical protein